jgi:DNA-binding transcriptional regulator YiaG
MVAPNISSDQALQIAQGAARLEQIRMSGHARQRAAERGVSPHDLATAILSATLAPFSEVAMNEITTQVGRYKVLDGSVPLSFDDQGEVDLTLAEWRAFDLRAAAVVFADAPEVGGAELKFARKTLGLKQRELARVLCVSEYTVSDWERDASPITGTIQRFIAEILAHVQRDGYGVLRKHLSDRPPAASNTFEVRRTGTDG